MICSLTGLIQFGMSAEALIDIRDVLCAAPELQCSGAPVLWCSGAPLLHGASAAPVLRCSGGAVLRSGALVLWCSRALVLPCSHAPDWSTSMQVQYSTALQLDPHGLVRTAARRQNRWLCMQLAHLCSMSLLELEICSTCMSQNGYGLCHLYPYTIRDQM